MQVSAVAGLGLSTHTHTHTQCYTLDDTECCETVNKQIEHSLARQIIHGVKLIIHRNDAVDHRDLNFMGSFILTQLRQRV